MNDQRENFNILMPLLDIEDWYLGIAEEPNARCLLCEDVDLLENMNITEC